MPTNLADSIVVVSDLPKTPVQFAYRQSFYHSEEYLKAQAHPCRRSYWLLDHLRKDILGNIHFDLTGDKAVSHSQAPFGSFNGLDLNPDQLLLLLQYLEEDLKASGINQITFNHPSFIYGGEAWLGLLVDHAYECTPLINHHLEVDSMKFIQKIHRMEQRKLVKAKNLEFIIYNVDSAPEVFDFVAYCREKKQQTLSLEKDTFVKSVRANARNFIMSGVHYQGTLIAAMVTVRVYPQIWYNFYPAHHPRFDKVSPLVFLTQQLYQMAFAQGVKILDLGTSYANEQPLSGLISFKERLGGVASSKWICRKQSL